MQEWLSAIETLFASPSLGLSAGDAQFFAGRLACFLTSGKQRRMAKYEKQDWYDFIGVASRGSAYGRILARGITLMLVAMKPDVASTRTVGTILVQLLIDILDPSRRSDRLLKAPTNDAWIDPWIASLQAAGVSLNLGMEVQTLDFDATGITGVRFTDASTRSADYYVLALPVEIARTVLSPALKAQAGIGGIDSLQVSWMNGVLFYLDQDIELSHGHAIYADSPWALTGISQQRFWTGLSLADYGQGNVQGILSTVISDWDTAGTAVVNKPARFCTAQEIKDEVWAQLVLHHANADPSAQLGGVTVHDWFLDPAITPSAAGATNDEPLLINNVDSWKDRPEATTLVPNLFLASDYVRTNSDLACMEGANEAARRAVNGILAASGSTAPICAIYELREPSFFEAAQAADDIAFAIDPDSTPALCGVFSTRIGPTTPVPPVSTPTGCSPWMIVLLVLVAALLLFILLSNA
jgi:uncharacterized protein with NAD-binding domain and iron-sulfur cluster